MAGKGSAYMREYRKTFREAGVGSPSGNGPLRNVANDRARMAQVASDLEKAGFEVFRHSNALRFQVYTSDGPKTVMSDGRGGFSIDGVSLDRDEMNHARSYNELMRKIKRMGRPKRM